MTTITLISDTHGLHKDLELPRSDIIIHSGDFCNSGSIKDAALFLEWFSKLESKDHILIAGNHDFICESNPTIFKALLRSYPNIIYLQDSEVTVQGLKIYGSPFTPTFNNWAFMLQRGKKIKAIWDRIPSNTDILVTHGPVYGYLDEMPKGGINWNIGCEELAKAVERVKPKLHVFGHIHCAYGKLITNTITRINASICNEAYDPVNAPITIKI